MKRFISLLLCTLMLCLAMPFSVFANENIETIVNEYIPVPEFYESDELFAAYAEREFYPEYATSVWGTFARDRLNQYGKKLYDSLKLNITAIANGTQASTTVTISSTMLMQWGVTYRFDASQYTANTAMAAMENQMQYTLVIDALLADCPYELYWFDKGEGWSHGGSATTNVNTVTITEYIILFSVANAYKANNYNEDAPTVNTAKTGATASAVANAKAIVAKYSDLTDYEKLVKYKEEICNLVSYNDAAAEDNTTPYGDPWQIIYVFDKNTSTNVVCEGYSKAYQYLCDKSSFENSNIACYSVSGATLYNGKQGGHMWNIVTMDDGKNYIADITNGDTGTIGSDGGLFLSGMNGSIANNYSSLFTPKIIYGYDSDTKSIWGTDSESILNLSSADYIPANAPAPHVCTAKNNTWLSDADYHWQECECGKDVNVTPHDSGAWRTTLEPQADSYGQMELHCTKCDRLLGIEVIPPRQPDHTCSPRDNSWNSNGNTHWQICECKEIINQDNHDNGTWVTTKAPEVGVSGEKQLKCTVCGYALATETLPALNPNPDPNPTVLVGDINGNGKIDARDYLLLKRAYFGTYTLTCSLEIADINGNGKIDARDYLLLKRAYFGTYTIK